MQRHEAPEHGSVASIPARPRHTQSRHHAIFPPALPRYIDSPVGLLEQIHPDQRRLRGRVELLIIRLNRCGPVASKAPNTGSKHFIRRRHPLMQRVLKSFAVLVPFLAATACEVSLSTGTGASGGGGENTSSTTGGGGASSATGTKACNDEAAAVCSLRDTCSPGYSNKVSYGSESVCQTRTAQTCINGLDANGTGNTAALIEACAAAYPSEMCADYFDSNPVTACQAPAGTLTTGAACGTNAQCTSGYCHVTPTTTCGTCQPLPVAGAACMVQADCGRDPACAIPNIDVADAGVPTEGVCAAWVPSGGACLTGYNPCEAGLACVGDDPTKMTMGTCQAAGATAGAACQTTRATMPNCDGSIGLTCIAPPAMNGMGTCVAISVVGAGAACADIGSPTTGYAVCGTSGLCKKEAPTDTMGTCVAAAADGAACDSDPAIGPPCLSPAKCVAPMGSPGTAGTCTVPNPTTCM
jgi:hypothetical protein